ncbi:Cytosolic Fe-S cluster assembly factor nubp1 [Porphyridium purpureum]|uniref:Cytosolic Fe-S cluster assembly factor NUBP1 homolog n=1 Tax=Porphyridium purpureum TaxID=35688 RepID=A0A5J4YM37_PORPP|nr:Cytosolic Fe-S cluster assembly factor nubp1 [Porphyridium purpureum]|eukprot:POR8200..scf291_13
MSGGGGDVPENAPANCPGTSADEAGRAAACAGCPNQSACQSGEASAAAQANERVMQDIGARLSADIRHKVLVLSGKGGVGKSTVAAQLCYALASLRMVRPGQNGNGYELNAPDNDHDDVLADVGLLDVDICGPSAPRLLGVEGMSVSSTATGWQPVCSKSGISVMSVGFLLGQRDDAVIWRGVRKTALITQFLRDVEWGALDYLVIDSPPGTSDEHISLVQLLKNAHLDGAVLVTTPQEVSLMDVRKEVDFCRKSGTYILGVVENMSAFVCPNCAHCSELFHKSTGGAQAMCEQYGIPFLGALPMDPALGFACETGLSIFEGKLADTPGAKALRVIVQNLLDQIQIRSRAQAQDKSI